MEQNVDNFIDNLFSNNLMAINGAIGAILIVIGVALMIANKSKNSNGKSSKKGTVGIICIGIGILVIASGIIQSFM